MKDVFEDLIQTIERNAVDNKATIENVKLWADSWRKEMINESANYFDEVNDGLNQGRTEAYDFCISRLRKAIKYSKEDIENEIEQEGPSMVSQTMMDDMEYLEYILDGILKRKKSTTITEKPSILEPGAKWVSINEEE